jgi:NAD-dependent dihydropyrimidine dehydrogenase PreA subunit
MQILVFAAPKQGWPELGATLHGPEVRVTFSHRLNIRRKGHRETKSTEKGNIKNCFLCGLCVSVAPMLTLRALARERIKSFRRAAQRALDRAARCKPKIIVAKKDFRRS